MCIRFFQLGQEDVRRDSVICFFRNSAGVHPVSRLKNLLKWVASSNPSFSAMAPMVKSVCTNKRFASRLMREEMKDFALMPTAAIVERAKVFSVQAS